MASPIPTQKQIQLSNALMAAIGADDTAQALFLLASGASPLARGEYNGSPTSPLWFSVKQGLPEVQKALLDGILEASRQFEPQTEEHWKEASKAANALNEALALAAHEDDEETFERLFKGAQEMRFTQQACYELLRVAARAGAQKVTRILLREDLTRSEAWLNDMGSSFSPPLEMALEKGWFSCAKILVEAGAPLHSEGPSCSSSCIAAWVKGFNFGPDASPPRAKALLEQMIAGGASVTGQDPVSGRSPLDLTLTPPQPLAAAMLIHYGANPNAPLHGKKPPSYNDYLERNTILREPFEEARVRFEEMLLEEKVAPGAAAGRLRM